MICGRAIIMSERWTIVSVGIVWRTSILGTSLVLMTSVVILVERGVNFGKCCWGEE